MVNVQHQHLQDALRPLLRQFAAAPRSVNQASLAGQMSKEGARCLPAET